MVSVFLLIALLVVSAGAVLYTTLVAHETEVSISGWLKFDGQNCGDLTIDNSFSANAGSIVNESHNLSSENNGQGNRTIFFTFNLSDSEGVDCNVWYDGSIVTSLVIAPGETLDITFEYKFDIMLVPGIYHCNCTLSTT